VEPDSIKTTEQNTNAGDWHRSANRLKNPATWVLGHPELAISSATKAVACVAGFDGWLDVISSFFERHGRLLWRPIMII
jgi:hypothetical protein